MTPAYQETNIEDSTSLGLDEGASCAEAVTVGQEFAAGIGAKADDFTVSDVEVDGDKVTVFTETDTEFDDTVYSLEWDGSKWLIASDGSAEEANADPARWVENWCDVEPGSTLEEAVELLGDPTGEFRGDDGDGGQVEWSKEPYSFTAFLGDDGTIEQLDLNETDLPAADKAKLGCGTARR